MMAEIFRIDCFSHEIISKNMRDYSSSAPEPATMFRHPAAPKRAGRRSDFRLTGQDFREGIVHIEGWLIADLGVDHTLVQIGGNLVSFAAKRGGVGADFAAVEVNGGDGLKVAAVADLVNPLSTLLDTIRISSILTSIVVKFALWLNLDTELLKTVGRLFIGGQPNPLLISRGISPVVIAL